MTILSPAEILERLPQREPFRFVDEILAVDEETIEARYTWRPEADFYRGHFPGNPVTPGVLLVEAMAQGAVVAHALYLFALQIEDAAALEKLTTFFTDAQVEFSGVVRPGETVRVVGKKVYFRRGKLRSRVEMRRWSDDELVCAGELSGMGVPR